MTGIPHAPDSPTELSAALADLIRRLPPAQHPQWHACMRCGDPWDHDAPACGGCGMERRKSAPQKNDD